MHIIVKELLFKEVLFILGKNVAKQWKFNRYFKSKISC